MKALLNVQRICWYSLGGLRSLRHVHTKSGTPQTCHARTSRPTICGTSFHIIPVPCIPVLKYNRRNTNFALGDAVLYIKWIQVIIKSSLNISEYHDGCFGNVLEAVSPFVSVNPNLWTESCFNPFCGSIARLRDLLASGVQVSGIINGYRTISFKCMGWWWWRVGSWEVCSTMGET